MNTPSISLCILIVEDHPSVASMLEATLDFLGCEVCVAANGYEALNVLETHPPEAIFLDMHLPVMDGRTLLHEVRWRGYTMPVWIMSGGAEAHTLKELLNEGAQGYLVKPFGLSALQQTLDSIFHPVRLEPIRPA